MKRVNQSESSQQIELKQHQDTNTTPDSLVKQQTFSQSQRKLFTFNVKRCMLLLMFIVASTLLAIQINAQDPPHIISHNTISVPEDFNFLVFCPVSYFHQKNSFKQSNFRGNDQLRRRLFETYSNRIEVSEEQKGTSNYNPNRTYLVQVTSREYQYTDANGTLQSNIELFYCGLVTGFYQTCEDSVVACSTPGPIFDITEREAVDIIWVNNLNSSLIPNQGQSSCLDPTFFNKKKEYCTLMAKINKTQTFLDATKNDIESKTAYLHIPISPKTWPMVTHLHGAEIRPTFDGNPLSWIHNSDNQKGNYGIAAFTYQSQCYYSSFDTMSNQKLNYNPPNIILRNIKTGYEEKNYKINRYPNQQNPGSLWYHDHSMHLTSFNVQNGLSGYYILRDRQVEQLIGIGRRCEKLVMLAGNFLKPSFQLRGFQTGLVYRFKFLNNNYDDGPLDVLRFSFSYNNCNDPIVDRQSFTIIGADSSLFNEGIYNQKSFVVAQAERLELLIQFKVGMDNFSICGDQDIDSLSTTVNNANIQTNQENGHHSRTKHKININNIKLADYDESNNICGNNRTSISNVVLPVPFIDLSLMPEEEIAVKRMRPLVWVRPVFTINGRTDFHKGWSQNPEIGTTEDWFIINTIFFAHPIHVHLINFQVIKVYDLRTINTPQGKKCSLYQLDFAITALTKSFTDAFVNGVKQIVFANNTINYVDLCNTYLLLLYKNQAFIEALQVIYPEHEVDQDRVSGMNVLGSISQSQFNQHFSSINSLISPPFNASLLDNLKYVPNLGAPSEKPYYSRWKDTAYVQQFKVFQYRIRWTKSNFTEQDKTAGTYFHVPADQLRQYPGFVYHCHILPHEDNEMMRPIMMQLPRNAKLDLKTPCNYNIESKQPVLKWQDKYNCVNKVCGNQRT